MKGLYTDIIHSILPLLDPHSHSNLTFLNKKFNKLFKSYNGSLKQSFYFGLLIPILFFIKHKDKLDMELAYAAKFGHLNLCSFSYFIKNGAIYINGALLRAAQGGHLNLCSFRTKAT